MGSESKGLSPPWSPATKNIIKNLKEVVDYTEPEIYAVLVEYDMNPDEAVQKLLSQDKFHEVKSKRERRKEMKETQNLRPWVNNNDISVRGSRGASEQSIGWTESIQQSFEENGNHAPFPSLPVPHLVSCVGESSSQQPHSSLLNMDNRGLVVAEASSAWPVTSFENLSMADIVRMGRLPNRGSQMSSEPYSHTHRNETNVSGTTMSDNAVLQKSCLEEQTVVEQWIARGPEDSVVSIADKDWWIVTDPEDCVVSVADKYLDSDHSEPDAVSNSSDPGHPAVLSNNAGAKLEQLNTKDEEEDCGVILPSHLQALVADCSHLNLSFGTFRSTSTSELPSDQSKDIQETSTTVDASSINAGQANMEEPLESLYGARRDGLNSNLFEEAKEGVSDDPSRNEYIRPALHDSNVDKIGHSSAELSFARTDPVVENQSIKSQLNTYVEYKSQARDELMSNLQELSVPESLQSQFLASQSMPTRHGSTSSSYSSGSILFSEVIQDRQAAGRGAFSAPNTNQHRIPNALKNSFEQPANDPYSTPSQSYSQLASVFQDHHQQLPGNHHQQLPGNYHQQLPGSHHQQLPGRGLQGANRFFGAYGNFGNVHRNSGNVLGNFATYSTPPAMVSNRGLSGVGVGAGGYQPQYSYPNKDLISSQRQNSSSSTWNQGSVHRPQAYAEELSGYYNLLQSQQQQGNQLPLQYQVGSGYSGGRQQSQVNPSQEHQRHHLYQQLQQQQQQRFGGSGVNGARSDLMPRRFGEQR